MALTNLNAEPTYYDHDQSGTGGRLEPLTAAEKLQHVNDNKFTGNTDVTSNENLPGTQRKGTLSVPPGQTAGDVYMRRDYNWLEYFATEVSKVETLITQARDKLGEVDVKPGNFTQANSIRTTTENLKTDYTANLDRVQNALRNLVTECRAVAKTYKTSDEMNEVKVDQLKTMFDQLSGELGKLAPVSVKERPAT